MIVDRNGKYFAQQLSLSRKKNAQYFGLDMVRGWLLYFFQLLHFVWLELIPETSTSYCVSPTKECPVKLFLYYPLC